MAVNKVIYGGNPIIDLTEDTLESGDQLLEGVTAHAKDGTVVVGTLVNGCTLQTAVVTLPVSGWSDGNGEMMNFVSLDGVSVDSVVIVGPTKSCRDAYTENGVYCAYQYDVNDSCGPGLDFGCDSVPTVELTVNVAIFT